MAGGGPRLCGAHATHQIKKMRRGRAAPPFLDTLDRPPDTPRRVRRAHYHPGADSEECRVPAHSPAARLGGTLPKRVVVSRPLTLPADKPYADSCRKRRSPRRRRWCSPPCCAASCLSRRSAPRRADHPDDGSRNLGMDRGSASTSHSPAGPAATRRRANTVAVVTARRPTADPRGGIPRRLERVHRGGNSYSTTLLADDPSTSSTRSSATTRRRHGCGVRRRSAHRGFSCSDATADALRSTARASAPVRHVICCTVPSPTCPAYDPAYAYEALPLSSANLALQRMTRRRGHPPPPFYYSRCLQRELRRTDHCPRAPRRDHRGIPPRTSAAEGLVRRADSWRAARECSPPLGPRSLAANYGVGATSGAYVPAPAPRRRPRRERWNRLHPGADRASPLVPHPRRMRAGHRGSDNSRAVVAERCRQVRPPAVHPARHRRLRPQRHARALRLHLRDRTPRT